MKTMTLFVSRTVKDSAPFPKGQRLAEITLHLEDKSCFIGKAKDGRENKYGDPLEIVVDDDAKAIYPYPRKCIMESVKSAMERYYNTKVVVRDVSNKDCPDNQLL